MTKVISIPSYYIRRAVSFFLALMFVLSTILTGTLGWMSLSQIVLGEAYGRGEGLPVRLLKLEKDAAGNETERVISGAEFYLYKTAEAEDIQIGGRYVTDADGMIELRLKPGDYYFVETDPGYFFTYDQDSSGNITRYPFAITGNETAGVSVTAYNRRLTGSLHITKTVQNADGKALTEEQRNTEFEFTVTFSGPGEIAANDTYTYKIDSGEAQSLINGGKLRLKHGQKAVFDELPAGLSYVAVETPATGYISSGDNHAGNILPGGTTAAFVNTYGSETGIETGSLKITKEVYNANGKLLTLKQRAAKFEFTAVIGEATYTFSLRNGESKRFDNIPEGIAYTVTEKDYSAEGYSTIIQEYEGFVAAGASPILLPFVNVYGAETEGKQGNLKFSKTVLCDAIDRDAEFEFRVALSGIEDGPISVLINGEVKEFSLVNGELSVFLKHGDMAFIPNLPAGTCVCITEKRVEGYTSVLTVAKGFIVGNMTSAAAFLNCKNKPVAPAKDTSLILKKVAAGEGFDLNKEFEFTIIVNGKILPQKIKLKAGQQSAPVPLKVGDHYIVIEKDCIGDGYVRSSITKGTGTATVAPITVTQTNTYIKRVMITVSGEKTWDKKGHTVSLPSAITIYLKNGNTLVATGNVTSDKDGKWSYSAAAPKYGNDGKEIKYSVAEAPLQNWTPAYSGYNIKNTYVPLVTGNEVSVRVTKVWQDDGKNRPGSMQVQLYKDGKIHGLPVNLSALNGWTKTWTGLEKGPIWTVDEVHVPTGYTKTISGDATNGFTITNRRGGATEEKTSVKVTKVWQDNNSPSRPKSVSVQLYKDNTASGNAVTLNAANNWSYTWTNLDKGPAWRVDEVAVPAGYDKTVTGSAASGFIITNATAPTHAGTVVVSGQKIWNHGSNTPANYPNYVTVLVKDGNTIVVQRAISAADNWSWSFTLDKFDNAGKEIRYTVDEVAISGYSKKVEGYNLINTYELKDPGKPDPGPDTGIKGDIALWATLMLLSMAALVVTVMHIRKPKYQPKYLIK